MVVPRDDKNLETFSNCLNKSGQKYDVVEIQVCRVKIASVTAPAERESLMLAQAEHGERVAIAPVAQTNLASTGVRNKYDRSSFTSQHLCRRLHPLLF